MYMVLATYTTAEQLYHGWLTVKPLHDPGYHYTKDTFVRPCVRTSGSSPEANRPGRKKLRLSANLKSGTTSRGSLTRPAIVLAPD